jgi:hypothetical protein
VLRRCPLGSAPAGSLGLGHRGRLGGDSSRLVNVLRAWDLDELAEKLAEQEMAQ